MRHEQAKSFFKISTGNYALLALMTEKDFEKLLVFWASKIGTQISFH
jgi:hypothetical protein